MLLSILGKCDTYLPIILSLLLPLRRRVSRDQWWHYEQKWGRASESCGTTVGSLLATKKCHTTQLSFYLDWIQFTKIFFFFSVLLAYNTQVLTHLKKKWKMFYLPEWEREQQEDRPNFISLKSPNPDRIQTALNDWAVTPWNVNGKLKIVMKMFYP